MTLPVLCGRPSRNCARSAPHAFCVSQYPLSDAKSNMQQNPPRQVQHVREVYRSRNLLCRGHGAVIRVAPDICCAEPLELNDQDVRHLPQRELLGRRSQVLMQRNTHPVCCWISKTKRARGVQPHANASLQRQRAGRTLQRGQNQRSSSPRVSSSQNLSRHSVSGSAPSSDAPRFNAAESSSCVAVRCVHCRIVSRIVSSTVRVHPAAKSHRL